MLYISLALAELNDRYFVADVTMSRFFSAQKIIPYVSHGALAVFRLPREKETSAIFYFNTFRERADIK